jgi:hypothetical protein
MKTANTRNMVSLSLQSIKTEGRKYPAIAVCAMINGKCQAVCSIVPYLNGHNLPSLRELRGILEGRSIVASDAGACDDAYILANSILRNVGAFARQRERLAADPRKHGRDTALRAFTAIQEVSAVHPTVQEEFYVFRPGLMKDDPRSGKCFAARGEWISRACASLDEVQKVALAHLRGMPEPAAPVDGMAEGFAQAVEQQRASFEQVAELSDAVVFAAAAMAGFCNAHRPGTHRVKSNRPILHVAQTTKGEVSSAAYLYNMLASWAEVLKNIGTAEAFGAWMYAEMTAGRVPTSEACEAFINSKE